ncbi:MAG: hypothetical protein P1U87_03545 [Verrucomicrobiales bacterium]|nr:hypothetical protein [Verrucomicrobiales bacterium]
MPRFQKYLIPLILSSYVSVLPAIAGTELLSHTYENLGGTKVELESVFGVAARNGTLPYRVSIRNNSGSERVWLIELSEGGGGRTLRTSTSHRLVVPAGGTVDHQILLPFAPEFTTYSYRNLISTVRSPGLPEISRNTGYQTVNNIPTIALSSQLASRSLATLDKEVKDRNSNDPRFGDPYETEKLPDTWRGYAGLDLLLVDRPSWKKLEQAQRRAILEWVRLGGGLEIFLTDPEMDSRDYIGNFAKLGIEGLFHDRPSNNYARLSLGTVTLREWDGKELNQSIIRNYPGQPVRSQAVSVDYEGKWTLADEFGSRDFNSALIFILLVVFAILVAPVNLFYFAGPGKRHRLFITTPIISLGACLLVILIIFIGDGLGGRGYRIAFADLQSKAGEMRLYITQEQISRTGVMTDSGFQNDRRIALEPLNLRDSEFNNLKKRSGTSIQHRFDGDRFLGGFFRSRSEQGFSIRAAEPTRARIERKAATGEGGPPHLISNFPAGIQFLAFHDEAGNFWRTPESVYIAPGSSIPLEKTAEGEFRNWVTRSSEEFGETTRKRIRFLSKEPGRFFAMSENASELFLGTHQKIDWEKETLLISGSVTPAAGVVNPAPPAANE